MMDINRLVFRNIFYLTLLLRREWFLPTLHRLRETQYLPVDELRALQLEKLNRLIQHARQNTLYYRDRLPASVTSLDDLNFLPCLTKDDVRKHASQLMVRHGKFQHFKTSSGSTSTPVTLLKDSFGAATEMAAMWRGYEWAGITMGDRQARFWSVPNRTRDRLRARLIDFVCNRRRISAFAYETQTIRDAMDKLNRFQPDYFYGYVSVLRDFAHFAANNPASASIQPKAVITTAEVLTQETRELIQRNFHTSVFNEYGCGEIGTIAHECENGALHLNTENLILETLDPNGTPTDLGTPGEICVTDLTNYSTPLIRYRLSDYATLSRNNCECGRTLPIIDAVHGRQGDVLTNTAGKNFHSSFFTQILNDAKKQGMTIHGVQFIQHPNLEITVKLVCDARIFENLSLQIKKNLKQGFDAEIPIVTELVRHIPREPSGKLRTVKRLTSTKEAELVTEPCP